MTANPFATLPLFDQLWVLLLMLWFLGGPFVLTYCLVRFFRDLRRIAVALENPPAVTRADNYKAFLEADAKRAMENKGVVLSQFGR